MIFPQVIIDPIFSQYGVAGLGLAGAWFMMKYFMTTLDKKDTQMNEFIKSTLDLQREFKVELVAALRELREEIRGRKDSQGA
jgi:hypothetical protein